MKGRLPSLPRLAPLKGRLPSFLPRLAFFAITLLLAALLAWQAMSWITRSGQALAPVVGQAYTGEPWMVTPTPSPTALPSPTPFDTPTPVSTATAAPTATPAPTVAAALPTPEPFLVEVAASHGIDPSATYVVVNQNAQRMSVIEDGHVLRTIPISTGDPDRGWYTPAWSGRIGDYWGTFSANGVSADNAWYLFRAGGSILIHSLPYTIGPNGTKAYQGLGDLGLFPASRGCIRLDPDEATWFTSWGPSGVPIVVLPWDGGSSRAG